MIKAAERSAAFILYVYLRKTAINGILSYVRKKFLYTVTFHNDGANVHYERSILQKIKEE